MKISIIFEAKIFLICLYSGFSSQRTHPLTDKQREIHTQNSFFDVLLMDYLCDLLAAGVCSEKMIIDT